jgi:hypothetical protein
MSRGKTALALAIPALAIGLALWWSAEEDSTEEPAAASSKRASPEVAEATAPATTATQAAAPEPPRAGPEVAGESAAGCGELAGASPGEGGRLTRVEVRASAGRGRGLFLARGAEKGAGPGEVLARVRPALTLLFEPHCATHCLGCFADLHKVRRKITGGASCLLKCSRARCCHVR